MGMRFRLLSYAALCVPAAIAVIAIAGFMTTRVAADTPPTGVEQCLNDGWKTVSGPSLVFSSEGDCVSFVTTNGMNPPNVPQATLGPGPTSRDQCTNGGWTTFGLFTNEGDCIAVAARNPPAQLLH